MVKKKEKRTNNDLQITTQKTKDRATRIQLKIGVNSCDLGQVGSFLRVLRFPPPIKLTSNDIIINIVEITSIETYQHLISSQHSLCNENCMYNGIYHYD